MPQQRSSLKSFLASCSIGALLGFLLLIMPAELNGGTSRSVFELVDSSVKNMSALNLALLAAGGLFWGAVLKWPNALFAAGCQVASLFAFAVIEMTRDPTSHNLWPFEFALYFGLGLLSVAGMGCAVLVKRLVRNLANQKQVNSATR